MGEKRKVPFKFINQLTVERCSVQTTSKWYRNPYYYEPPPLPPPQKHQHYNNDKLFEKKISKRRNYNDNTSYNDSNNNNYFKNNNNYAKNHFEENAKDQSVNTDVKDKNNYKHNYYNDRDYKSSKSLIAASKLEPYVSLNNFEPSPCDYITMPIYARKCYFMVFLGKIVFRFPN